MGASQAGTLRNDIPRIAESCAEAQWTWPVCRLSKFGQGFKWKFFSPAAWMAGERRADEQTSSASCASTGNEHTQKRPGGLAGPFHLLPPGRSEEHTSELQSP